MDRSKTGCLKSCLVKVFFLIPLKIQTSKVSAKANALDVRKSVCYLNKQNLIQLIWYIVQ